MFRVGDETTRSAIYSGLEDAADISFRGFTLEIDDVLLFDYTFTRDDPDDPNGIAWDANSLRLNGSAIQLIQPYGKVAAILDHAAQPDLPGQRVRLDRTPRVTEVSVTSMPAMNMTYDVPTTIAFTVTFNGSVTVDTTYGTPAFVFDLGNTKRTAAYASGSGSSELLFVYAVAGGDFAPDGIAWAANPIALDGGTVRFANIDAVLYFVARGPLPGHRVDVRPLHVEAIVDTQTIDLVYSEALDEIAVATTAFDVTVGSSDTANPDPQ